MGGGTKLFWGHNSFDLIYHFTFVSKSNEVTNTLMKLIFTLLHTKESIRSPKYINMYHVTISQNNTIYLSNTYTLDMIYVKQKNRKISTSS